MYDDFNYIVTPSGCIVTKYTGKEKIVTVPKEINGHQVNEIGMYTFAENKSIEKVVIPEGVKQIGIYAFAGCSRLETLILPKSLRKICYRAFLNCPSFKEIRFKGTKKQWGEVDKHTSLSGAKIIFNEPNKLSEFLNDCKDADEIRKE